MTRRLSGVAKLCAGSGEGQGKADDRFGAFAETQASRLTQISALWYCLNVLPEPR